MDENPVRYRYNVFRGSATGELVGTLEGDGYVRSPQNKVLYQANLLGFFNKQGKFIGYTRDAGRDGAKIVAENGECLFVIVRVP